MMIDTHDAPHKTERSRRIKIFGVTDTEIMRMLNAYSSPHEYLIAPIFPELPAGYVVESVFWEHSRGCFGIVVSHESWIEIGIGYACEWIGVFGWDTCSTAYKRIAL